MLGKACSCLDHMFVNTDSLMITSDHLLLNVAEKKTQKFLNKKHKLYIDKTKLRIELTEKSWNNIYLEDDLEIMTNNFICTLKQKIELATLPMR